LDILINNAGITRDKMTHLMTDEWWNLVIDVNLRGTFNCIRSAAPYLRDPAKKEIEQRGRPAYNRKIVNFFSTAAIRGNPGQISSTAGKRGNGRITPAGRAEVGKVRINGNAIAPRLTRTRLKQEKKPGDQLGIPREQFEEMVERIPLGRAAEPEDIARV